MVVFGITFRSSKQPSWPVGRRIEKQLELLVTTCSKSSLSGGSGGGTVKNTIG